MVRLMYFDPAEPEQGVVGADYLVIDDMVVWTRVEPDCGTELRAVWAPVAVRNEIHRAFRLGKPEHARAALYTAIIRGDI